MSETERETFLERTLGNLAVAWRDIAHSAARGVGFYPSEGTAADDERLRAMMRECLEARGGEVSARARAADLGRTYLELDAQGKRRFLSVLARDFAADRQRVDAAVDAWQKAGGDEARLAAELALRRALVPPRLKLLTQFNALPEGVKFLVDLRADLLALSEGDPWLRALDEDLFELLGSWFDTGFLDLERIVWASSAALLEKLIVYEAVHEITSWDDLRNRLDSDRRCYALFHPRMPQEPLAFVEVALVEGLAGNIQALLDESAPQGDPAKVDTAVFYSISNTQKGLRGIAFGEFLIKMVVQRLAQELPQIKTFATLSPVPGFRVWLAHRPGEEIDAHLSGEERNRLRARGESEADTARALAHLLERPDWHADEETAKLLEGPLLRLAARYFLQRREDGRPLDPVARFHLRNGARLERINWLGDTSKKGLRQSAGIMVNYRYVLDEIEKNHEAYMAKGTIAVGSEVRTLTKRLKENGSTLRRLRLA